MSSTPWTLEPDFARLESGILQAVVHFGRPDRGLHSLVCDTVALPGGQLMTISRPGCNAEDSPPNAVDRFVRGDDLVISYGESAEWPVQIDAVFRAPVHHPCEHVSAQVELIVSVRTLQWNSQCELALESRLKATEVLRLVEASNGNWAATSSSQEAMSIRAAEPRCVLVRLENGQASYVEMIAPAGSSLDEMVCNDPVAIRHRLFPCALEKGVILRARVLGAMVARACDTQVAFQLYRDFMGAEPPLGS